ncbi:hypothetical protein HDU77_006647 [Chytriomyces hyalinus]|nr:hypothetical protein HDU77_006647 [Chytriomyces hyalinus]
MEGIENQPATLAGRIETKEKIVSENVQQLQDAIMVAKADSVLASLCALLDSATSALKGLRDKKATLINEMVALIKCF